MRRLKENKNIIREPCPFLTYVKLANIMRHVLIYAKVLQAVIEHVKSARS